MRIEAISLSWFRAAADNAVMDTGSKSVVVYGANGSGKSTFPDAIEYLVTDGRIGHLAHEYSGSRQEKGVRNTHCPPGVPAVINVRFDTGGSIENEIAPNGTHSTKCSPEALSQTVQAWKVDQLLLRQDEVANFIHATKGEKYSVLLPLLGLEHLEQAADNLHQLQQKVTAISELTRKEVELQTLTKAVTQILPDASEESIAQALKGLAGTYLADVPTELPRLIQDLSSALDARIRSLEPEMRRHLLLTQIRDEMLAERLATLTEAEAVAKLQVDALVDRRIAVLEPTSTFLDQLETIKEDVDCPACGRRIKIAELFAHVRDELQALHDARSARDRLQSGRRGFASALKQTLAKCSEDEVARWLGLPPQTECKAAFDKLSKISLDLPDEGWPPEARKALDACVPIVISHIKAAVETTPPSTKQLVDDQRKVEAAGSWPEIRGLQFEITDIRNIISALASAEAGVRDVIGKRTSAIVREISTEVQRSWAKLHPDEPIEDVRLYIPEDSDRAIDIGLKFFGVDQPSPRLTLSEGHRNSLSLCIFLALLRLDQVYDGPIILDDIVSSLDREHRGRLVNVLLEDFGDRQVLLFTHDREWFAELRARLPTASWKFMALRPWENPAMGLQWSVSADTFDDARSLITVNPEAAGNRVRAIMDTQLAIAAEKLQIRMPFLRGDRNDSRTSVYFLERIISEGQRRLKKRDGKSWREYSEPVEAWREAHTLLVAWANRSSHTGSLTATEAKRLLEVCEIACGYFRCSICDNPIWIADQASRERLQCECGEIQWRYG